MSSTNGHHQSNAGAASAPAAKIPAISFEYRGPGGLELRRVVPLEGSLSCDGGEWVFHAHDLDTRGPCLIHWSRIVMPFGLPSAASKSPPRCLCGAIEGSDCGCHAAPIQVDRTLPPVADTPTVFIPTFWVVPPAEDNSLDGWRRGKASNVGVRRGADGTLAEKGGDCG